MAIDRDVAVLEAIGEVLECMGHKVVLFQSPANVLDQPPAEKFEMALIDNHLGTMDGIEFIELFRAHYPLTKIIFMDAGIDALDISTVLHAGAIGVLKKPFGMDELQKLFDAHSGITNMN